MLYASFPNGRIGAKCNEMEETLKTHIGLSTVLNLEPISISNVSNDGVSLANDLTGGDPTINMTLGDQF